MATTTIPNGTYFIEASILNAPPGQYLTRENSGAVTILLSNGQDNQEWQINNVDNGNIIISVPRFIPGAYLTYEGAPDKPEANARTIWRPDPQRPPNEWHVDSGKILVAGSDFGIKIVPPPIFPPILALELKEQLEWRFVPVNKE